MNHDADDPQLPGSLKSELFRLYRVDVRASAEVDRGVLNRARAHLARRGRLRLFIGIAGAAVAVIVVVTAIIVQHRPARYIAAANGDVNGDGVVDIRDALLLARKLDGGKVSGIDVNHDGVTDRRDVDAIAMLAVRIPPEAGGEPNGGAVR